MHDLELYTVRQTFDDPAVPDPAAAVADGIRSSGISFPPGARIAVAVGSRGITDIVPVVKAVVDTLIDSGAAPFIIPAMGSHGGATADGQAAVLAGYGITETSMGVPVRSALDVVEITGCGLENRVFMDKHAWDSDGVILVNRIKAHTDFHGPIESGLCKMGVIGLGKHRQALEIHSFGIRGLRELIVPTARVLFETGKVLLGVGIVENAYDRTMDIRVLPASRILEAEPGMLALSKAHMPSLPVDDIDILMIDEIGKDVSGVGLDPNIIGRIRVAGTPEPLEPRVTALVACALSPGSHGNAIGVGLADIITRRLFDGIDYPATFENLVTSTFLERGKIPLIADNPAAAYGVALRICALPRGQAPRVVRIRNTLRLAELQVSKAVLDEISETGRAVRVGEVFEAFGPDGNFSTDL